MQCPHQEEKNWTSQAEEELVTAGFRLPLLRITSGSSSVYSRAAAPTKPGTSHHRTAAAFNQDRSIPAVRRQSHQGAGGEGAGGEGDGAGGEGAGAGGEPEQEQEVKEPEVKESGAGGEGAGAGGEGAGGEPEQEQEVKEPEQEVKEQEQEGAGAGGEGAGGGGEEQEQEVKEQEVKEPEGGEGAGGEGAGGEGGEGAEQEVKEQEVKEQEVKEPEQEVKEQENKSECVLGSTNRPPQSGNMSSPRVGVVRDSMLTNPLLIKASLGQSRSRGLPGPGPDFTFGTSSSSIRDEGVAEVLSSWRVQPRREDSAPHQPAVPDFVSLNRNAVRSGLVTSKELSQYRAQRGGAMSQSPAHKKQRGGASQRPAMPDITFGVTTRASSPLSNLLSHQYARDWLDQQLRRNQSSSQRERQRVRQAEDGRDVTATVKVGV
ncbi:hypothetical protein L3Q82_007040 [Scortum barcoo]|uniref:Uncharacterized protein n=1 Tax=Scortum barcoo TaxID=214431 RepID=A0ACB8WZP5_9TELE|nr:hypothetical protein L3Q82_007040 [Scortum barcoo]